jgi:hypothetical protein
VKKFILWLSLRSAPHLARGAPFIGTDKLVFIDETGASTKMTVAPRMAGAYWPKRRSATGKTTTSLSQRCGAMA